MKSTESIYTKKAAEAIASPTLQSNLDRLQQRFGKGAMKYWAEMDDPEIRDRVKASRMRTFEHLDIVLTELAANVRKRGGKVFFAENAQDAVNYTLEVAERNKVKTVVKGKSMTSIEIGIDPALEHSGIEVVETDLGEFIVQQAGDDPSHILAPCIHFDRERIGQLFADKLGIEYTSDPPSLTRAAREALREKMLSAEMGLTGCNLACAETGHISLVSNEGNIRMTTTVPKVHVALMGLERVVPTLHEHGETLQLLTKGATLQNLTTYVSFLGGPSSDNAPDGPKEFHLVILDNGRSKILGSPEFQEVLACIRCGACLNICPVYGKIGGHAYNSPYCGPIGAVLTPLMYGINEHADLCKGETLCGACLDICPVKNDLPRMLSELRYKLAYGDNYWNTTQAKMGEAHFFYGWSKAVSNSFLYRSLVKTGRLLQFPFVGKDKTIHHLKGFAGAWTKDRDLPPIAKKTFTELWKQKFANRKQQKKLLAYSPDEVVKTQTAEIQSTEERGPEKANNPEKGEPSA